MRERVQQVNIGMFASFRCLVCHAVVTLYRNSVDTIQSGCACQDCGTSYVATWHDPIQLTVVETNEEE